jgi:phage tail protein X
VEVPVPINNIGGVSAAGFGTLDGTTQSVATVQVGDVTISDVANRLKVDRDALLQANPQIKDVHQKLSAGQELSFPQATATPDQSQKGIAPDIISKRK